MNFKGIIATLTFTLFFFGAGAQEDRSYNPDECAKYKSLYYQYLKQGAYRDATYFWSLAYDYCGGCDSIDAGTLSNGRVAYSKLLKQEEDKETPDQEIIKNLRDSLYWIAECGIQKNLGAEWIADYASMLVSDKDPRHKKIDSLWAMSIHDLKDKATYIHFMQYFRHLIINTFNDAPAEEKDAVRNFVIEEYLKLSDYCSTAISKAKAAGDSKTADKYQKAQEFMDKYFAKIVQDCDVLNRVLDGKLSELPQNKEEKLETVKKYLDLMKNKKCDKDTTFAKYVDTLVTIEPSADAYYFQGTIAYNNKDYKKAAEAFEKAVEMEGDGENSDKYKYELAKAQYAAHQYTAAFRTAKTVGGEYQGKAMVICGDAIAATANSCGESTFERKANYWLANDYYQKARALGEDVSGSKYLSNGPTTTECFEQNITNGSTITLSCWGESTTVRCQ